MSLELLSVPKNPWRGHLIVQNSPLPESSKKAFFFSPQQVCIGIPSMVAAFFLTILFFLLLYNL